MRLQKEWKFGGVIWRWLDFDMKWGKDATRKGVGDGMSAVKEL